MREREHSPAGLSRPIHSPAPPWPKAQLAPTLNPSEHLPSFPHLVPPPPPPTRTHAEGSARARSPHQPPTGFVRFHRSRRYRSPKALVPSPSPRHLQAIRRRVPCLARSFSARRRRNASASSASPASRLVAGSSSPSLAKPSPSLLRCPVPVGFAQARYPGASRLSRRSPAD